MTWIPSVPLHVEDQSCLFSNHPLLLSLIMFTVYLLNSAGERMHPLQTLFYWCPRKYNQSEVDKAVAKFCGIQRVIITDAFRLALQPVFPLKPRQQRFGVTCKCLVFRTFQHFSLNISPRFHSIEKWHDQVIIRVLGTCTVNVFLDEFLECLEGRRVTFGGMLKIMENWKVENEILSE